MIHIIQCLCPKRHAILAVPYDPKTMSTEQAMAFIKGKFDDMVKRRVINPWCGLCMSPKLDFEDGVTKFKTLEEAFAPLMIEQAKQVFAMHLMNNDENN